MCIGGDVYNTTVNVNGKNVFSSRYTPCCCNMYSMNSCFGFGYGMGGFGCGGFGAGLGVGVGFAAGMALAPALPNLFKGVGKALGWVGSKVIAPVATFAWNNVLKPVGKVAWNGIKWVGNTIAKGAKAVGKGIANLWNKIFHKKSKASKAEE